MGYRGTCVVIEGIGSQKEFGTAHLHVVVEHRHLGLCVVLTPVGCQRRIAVNHLSAFEEIGIVVHAVEIQTIRVKRRLLMFQHDVISCPCHLFITIVIGILTHQRQRITLIHLYISESLEGVAALVEISTVTIQTSTLMGEMHLTVQDGCIGIDTLVKMQEVGMYQIDTRVLHLSFPCRTLALFLGINLSQAEGRQQYEEYVFRLGHHLFIPSFVLEIAILIVVIQMGIDTLDLIDNPLMDTLILTFLENHIFQHLEILGDRCLMAIDTVLQFRNHTDRLSALVDHLEGFGNLPHL